MAKEHHSGDGHVPGRRFRNADPVTEAEIEALEDAVDLRLGRERLRLVEIEGTVSWESVKAKYGL